MTKGQIGLGCKVRDLVSGLEGIAVSRVEYLNGCIQYGIKPKVGKDGTTTDDAVYLDEGQLEYVSVGIKNRVAKTPERAGPSSDMPGRRPRPSRPPRGIKP